ncbi:hypothetical protein ACS0TY_017172 [Phlomoides rotata]
MDSERRSNFKILMFPWLAHGHILPFLELAKRILKIKNFHIYLCTTPINFSSIDAFIHANSLRNSIELVQLDLALNPQLPPHYHTTKNLPNSIIASPIQGTNPKNRTLPTTFIASPTQSRNPEKIDIPVEEANRRRRSLPSAAFLASP